MTIPVIDISAFRRSDSKGKQNAADQIRQACLEHGFFYITGHGISIELQKELEDLSQVFFALPLEEKLKIRMEFGGRAWRGYFPVGNELTSGKPDQKEGIYFGSELAADHPKVKSNTLLHGRNLFPEIPSQLSEVVVEYMARMTELGHLLMKAIALSLQLPEDHFQSTITSDPFVLFRIFHYPAQQHQEELWGVGEHTDYGLLTILKQDEVGGLQVKSNNAWIDAPPIENTFVCNIGDMLDRMTGGLYRSTPHRVKNTSGKNRLSFPFFFDPNFEATVKPINGCFTPIGDHDSERWDNEDVYDFEGTYGEYLTRKVFKVFPQLLSHPTINCRNS